MNVTLKIDSTQLCTIPDSHIVFQITLQMKNTSITNNQTTQWSILKRYSQFHTLNTSLLSLSSQSNTLPYFPGKLFINSLFRYTLNKSQIDKRKIDLERYMQILLLPENSHFHSSKQFTSFLQFPDSDQNTAGISKDFIPMHKWMDLFDDTENEIRLLRSLQSTRNNHSLTGIKNGHDSKNVKLKTDKDNDRNDNDSRKLKLTTDKDKKDYDSMNVKLISDKDKNRNDNDSRKLKLKAIEVGLVVLEGSLEFYLKERSIKDAEQTRWADLLYGLKLQKNQVMKRLETKQEETNYGNTTTFSPINPNETSSSSSKNSKVYSNKNKSRDRLMHESKAKKVSLKSFSKTQVPKEILGTAGMSMNDLKAQQNLIIANQDGHLEGLGQIVKRQKEIGMTIGKELENQNRLLDNVYEKVEKLESKTEGVMQRAEQISKKL